MTQKSKEIVIRVNDEWPYLRITVIRDGDKVQEDRRYYDVAQNGHWDPLVQTALRKSINEVVNARKQKPKEI